MENSKLDKLFEAARQQEPIISLEEAMEKVSQKVDHTPFGGGVSGLLRFKNLALGSLTAAVIVGGIYLTMRSPQSSPIVETSKDVPSAVEEVQHFVGTGQLTESDIHETDLASATPTKTEAAEATAPAIKPAAKVVAKNEAKKEGDEHFGSIVNNAYLIENQTVNIANDKGQFKVHFNGADVASIVRNDVELNSEEWVVYDDIIAEAKTVKASMGINAGNSGNKKFVDYLFSSLKDRGLIENNLSTIKFSKLGLLVDGKEVDSTTHQAVVNRYKELMGEDIGSRTLYFN